LGIVLELVLFLGTVLEKKLIFGATFGKAIFGNGFGEPLFLANSPVFPKTRCG
jgi:hypothetical protein